MASEIQAWLWAFLFTQVVEVPIWAYALSKHRRTAAGRERWPIWTCAAVGFGATAITHPFVWFAFPRYAPGGYLAMVIQAEVFAVIVEASYASLVGLRWSLLWSLLANAASAGLGLLSREMLGWP